MSGKAGEFKTWAIVEIMGHQKYAGMLTEETIAGTSMLRIDIPAVGARQALTKYVGGGSVYCLTPCSEETARYVALGIDADPISEFDARRMVQGLADEKQRRLASFEHEDYEDGIDE